jgi:hypothetical protein
MPPVPLLPAAAGGALADGLDAPPSSRSISWSNCSTSCRASVTLPWPELLGMPIEPVRLLPDTPFTAMAYPLFCEWVRKIPLDRLKGQFEQMRRMAWSGIRTDQPASEDIEFCVKQFIR